MHLDKIILFSIAIQLICYRQLIYIRQMWQSKKITAHPPPTNNSYTRQYPSKLISQLMDSDSENEQPNNTSSENQDNYQYPLTQQSHKSIKNPSTSTLPPLTTKTLAKQKENISIESNRNNKQIRYSYYRLQGQKMIESTNPYNSLNLEDASMIKDSNEVLNNELERMKEQKKDMERMVCQLVNENRVLKRQLNLTKEELETKDNCYDQIAQQLKNKSKQQEKNLKKIQILQKELTQKREEICRLENQKKKQKYSKKDSQMTQYIEGLNANLVNKQNFDTGASYRKNSNDSSDKIYGDITAYLVKRVEELRDRLMEQKMSKNVENIIEEFMAQLVNINPITVSRVIPKNRQACTPVRKYKTQLQSDNSPFIRNSLFRQQQQTTITPIKPQQKQKNQQLRNLQKSLQKLRDMQKSYISTTPQQQNNTNLSNVSNLGKDSYNSLDRSSVMGLDRSKSRRKKIFE